MKKLSNTETGLKKSVALKNVCTRRPVKERKEIREGQKWQCHETYLRKKRKLFHVITNSFSLFHHREFYKF